MISSEKSIQQLEEILDPISARSLEEIIDEAHELGELELGGYSSPNAAEIRFKPGGANDKEDRCCDTVYIRETSKNNSMKQNIITAIQRAKCMRQVYADLGWLKSQP